MTLPIAVIVATRGRPEIAGRLVASLLAQSRVPDRILLVAGEAADIAGITLEGPVEAAFGPPGLCQKRNLGLGLVRDSALVVFFDDDFVPSRRWIEGAEGLFAAQPDLACLTGEVLADGIHGPGLSFDEGLRLVTARDRERPRPAAFREGVTPYGCNMAFRTAALAGEAFDERLVLYGWQEDTDFGSRIGRRGRLLWSDAVWGVHLGVKGGRVPGVRLGYSQVANPIYLARKGTLRPAYCARLMTKNLIANAVKSLRPEPHVDRIGRLRGNLLALRDVLTGRIEPERAERL